MYINPIFMGTDDVELEYVERDIKLYDAQIDRGVKFHNDDQLRRIASARNWPGDRIRMCKFQKVLDPKAMPLIAVRYRIITRKSLGGIKTDLETDLLNIKGSPVHLAKSFFNLVSNAAEAMPNGGLLTITTNNQYLEQTHSGL
jgi:predicted oxidoreductase